MKKNRHKVPPELIGTSLFLKITRICAILVFVCTSQAIAAQVGASVRITLDVKNKELQQVLKSIGQQTRFDFLYNVNDVKNVIIKDASFRNATLEEAMSVLLKETSLEYEIMHSAVVIRAKSNQQPKSTAPKERVITGVVKDASGNVLTGVTVLLKGTTVGSATNAQGKFTISVPVSGTQVLVFSYVGMQSKEVVLKDVNTINVVLQETAESVKEVVVTGIFSRKKESFTGSASTYTTTDIKSMGSQNVLQSLKTLDPAFAILENNQWGSDPNHLPNMEIRGKSSMLGVRDELETDPNQPLFILDGFESSLSAINDLDINRVASITILKDAASTAIYGSKAANGVVVVETIKPEAGRLQVSYTGNVNISMPDLSSYNLMNSSEKLQFELLAGKYTPSSWTALKDIELRKLYNEKLRDVESGIDTYWLGEPVRVGVNHKHSLYVRGGEGAFLFGLGLGYNGNNGVMKESKREVISGNIDLSYRVSKLQFSNKFSVSSTDINNPVVSFSEYAAANPYYRKVNDDGSVTKWLEYNDYVKASNPLWNASLNSRNIGKNVQLSNYFMAEYNPMAELKLRGRVGITYANNDTEKFVSRDDTRYEKTEILKKGEYTTTNQRQNQYECELSATYAKLIDRHQINAVLGGNVKNRKVVTQGYSAQGFPEGDFSYPSFSNGYPENGRPVYYESVDRSVDGYLNVGYSYDNRYLLDVNFRTSGSSVFGSSKKYNTTYSVGLAWNLHNESFIRENVSWINTLKIRASIGNPGNQSFESSNTLLVYSFAYNSMNYFGMGSLLSKIGNPDLKWQTTLDKNIGIDLNLFNNRLSITADYYHKVTDPLLVAIGMPWSSGLSTYYTNAGEQTSQGLTASASYYIIKDLKNRFTWQVRANLRTQKVEINKIGNKLSALNSSGKGANTVRYYDGADPDDIWTVRSAYIDPSSGRELFYDKQGEYTYDYDYDNEVVCGNTRPDIEGIIGTSLGLRGWSLNINFRYRTGADVYNAALYNKVENITTANLIKNQDKRALYDRWQNPGDNSRFKNIANAVYTPMSSRFIQTENTLSLESIYLSYEFSDGWIKKIGLSNLRFFASMRDVFRLSSIKSERGLDYPFARTIESGLSFNF